MNKAIQLSNQTKSINLDIDGMTCAACAARIERILSKNNNILDSSVSFPLKLATIDILENSNFQIEEVIESVNKIGYKAGEAQEENENKKIKFIKFPEELKQKYQSYTCANIQKLRKSGYVRKFTSLEEGIKDVFDKKNS